MKAILVTVELTTRIIVNDDFNIDEPSDADYKALKEIAVPNLNLALHTNGIGDILTQVEEDIEVPYLGLKEDYLINTFNLTAEEL